MSKNLLKTPRNDSLVLQMAALCIVGLGGFLMWAGLVPLEEGVAATGSVVVEDQRKLVQHLEGGIVEEIYVRDGQRVEAGDRLLTLQDTASLANRDQAIQDYASLAASVERLTALRNGDGNPSFAFLEKLTLGAQERADIIDREKDLFDQQLEAQQADISVLEARREAAVKTASAREQQITIVKRSLSSARDELRVTRTQFEQQLVRRDQLTRSERLVADLESEIARLDSERVAALSSEQDFVAQLAQTRAQASQDISSALLSTRAELLSVEERLNAAQDVLNRAVIIAPVSGEVLNLQAATVGGVVRPGETILEIIPSIREVTASVRIRPADRASVFQGQTVRTQISAYKGWQAPRLNGDIINVSADLKTDPATSAVYYEARIRIPAEEIERADNIDITPGMPVDAFIYSGARRTTLDYFFAPLTESLFVGLRRS